MDKIGGGIKLFILEDEKDVCVFGKEYFNKKGFKAFTALSGNAAINTIKKQKPQIAILDIYLPGEISGIDVLKFIKEKCPQSYCIMVTKEDDESVKQKAIQLGAFTYLTKPLTIKELDKVLKKVVNRIRKGAK